ncbi:MAG: U32 family peptidase [Planctomycetaceae bacterium]|nr:U32 family peptidase [Planctomycetaceae bacterium]
MQPLHAKPEILAPAGGPESGYAALHYGADAVYLGLKSFSARAEAVNFSPDELARFVAFAHSFTPARKVYLALNTLVREDELGNAAESLFIAAEAGVDAVIVQDLGIAKLVRDRFPDMEMHASTQMALHNLAGVREAAQLGFSRVTMARELTLDELRQVTAGTDLEIEVFIHGTLCYSYSGLCLFSSIVSGRSGNRGRCVYSCREAADTPIGQAHPFSLKDMALGPRVLELAKAGVASLKIEGRKKSPLYVAATVDYYRRIIDGTLRPDDVESVEARLQTIFARPWTQFFLDSRRNPDAADPEVVGHRGARVGTVDGIIPSPNGPALLFRPAMPVERHDGLQVDIPGVSRPYGFPVDNLFQVAGKGRLRPVFAVEAGEATAVSLPGDAPPLAKGLPVYQSSSQSVKRSYPYPLPSASDTSSAPVPLAVTVTLAPTGDNDGEAEVRIEARAAVSALFAQVNPAPLRESIRASIPAFPARDAGGAEKAARASFERLGGSRFHLAEWQFDNPATLYAKPGDWNRLRRDLIERLESHYTERRQTITAFLFNSVLPDKPPPARAPGSEAAWSLRLDSPALLSEFAEDDLTGIDDIAVTIGPNDSPDSLSRHLGGMTDRVRLIVPPILREREWRAFQPVAAALVEAGYRRWLVGNLGALPLFPSRTGLDLEADWPLYMVNTMAARQLFAMGMTAATASPECAMADVAALLASHADRVNVMVYSDLPLFISAACAHAHIGLCRTEGGRACGSDKAGLSIHMERSGGVTIYPQGCGSVVVGDTPYSLVPHLATLKELGARRLCVDLRWRPHTPSEARSLWTRVRRGAFTGGTAANFIRG